MKVYSQYHGRAIGEFDISPNANLSDTNLSGANLSDTNLSGANLSDTNLSGANLYCANLRGASLSGANLSGANLSGANLSGANLRDADLRDADLSRADLSRADLSGSDLSGSDLFCADLKDAKLPEFQIPQDEELIVFKKLQSYKIAKLQIPIGAKRTASLVGNKCRAERAIVVEIYDSHDSKVKHQRGHSLHNSDFIYEVGKEIRPKNGYNGDIRYECRPGIHFFMTEEEARKY